MNLTGVLTEAFDRLPDLVRSAVEGLSPQQLTWAPAEAFNVSVSNASEFSDGVITVNCAVLDCVTGAVVAVGRALGWAVGCAPVADAPIFSAT